MKKNLEILQKIVRFCFFPNQTPFPSRELGCFPFTKNFGKFLLGILGISIWEESIPFVTSPIRLQAPLRRFTKKPDALVNYSAIFSNASLFVAFPSNKMPIMGMCGYEKSDICMSLLF